MQDATRVLDGSLLEFATVLVGNKMNVGNGYCKTLTILEDRRTGVSLGYLEVRQFMKPLRDWQFLERQEFLAYKLL